MIRCFCIAISILLFSASAWAELNEEQYRSLDEVLSSTLSALQGDADKSLDLVMDAVAEAYGGSSYSNNPAAEGVRRRLSDECSGLKTIIAGLGREIKAARSGARDPAVMIVLLSKEQAVSFQVYRLVRSAAEMADLAHATSRRDNATSGEFLTKLMQNHEIYQDTISLAIQGTASTLMAGVAEARARREILALAAAIETYKADNAIYPQDENTNRLRPDQPIDPAAYAAASETLYKALSGKNSDNKPYFVFPPAVLRSASPGHTCIVDPWGNSYGYATTPGGYKLWSTTGGSANRSKWISSP